MRVYECKYVYMCVYIDLNTSILITYMTHHGESRVMTYPITLPLWLVCRVHPASKSAVHKYTLGCETVVDGTVTNGDNLSVVLTDVFDDVLYATQVCY